MKNLSLALILVFGVSLSFNAFGDNNKKEAKHNLEVKIGTHALVALSSNTSITLEPAAPTTAGEGLNFDVASASDNSIYLQYSSIKRNSDNSISVSMTGDQLPTGVSIEVEAENAQNGKGQIGSSNNRKLTLANGPQDLITGIGSCYTGTGSTNGHKLKYTLKMSSNANYQSLVAKDYTSVVTYTITEK